MKKKIILLLPIPIMVLLIVGCYFYFLVPIALGGKEKVLHHPLSLETILTKEEVNKDRIEMIQNVESIHPYFVMEKDQTAYLEAKNKYMDLTNDSLSLISFKLYTSQYLSFFEDGHTHVGFGDDLTLGVKVKVKNDKIIDENLNKEIGSVSGVKTEDIVSFIIRSLPYENYIAKEKCLERNFCSYTILKYLNPHTDLKGVEIEYEDNTSILLDFKENNQIYNTDENSFYMEEDVFVIDFNQCIIDDNFKSIVAELKKKVDLGLKKVIIDCRGNGGGTSKCCVMLLEAMNMKAPEYDTLIRFSKEAQAQRGYIRTRGFMERKGSNVIKKNSDISLVVLTDRDTFSSATMMAVYVNDGELETIIGEPSSNNPSSYGDIIYFDLGNSHILGTISHKRFIRPNGNTQENILMSTFQTSSQDAFAKALSYLNS